MKNQPASLRYRFASIGTNQSKTAFALDAASPRIAWAEAMTHALAVHPEGLASLTLEPALKLPPLPKANPYQPDRMASCWNAWAISLECSGL
jgi:hypothetical protein